MQNKKIKKRRLLISLDFMNEGELNDDKNIN
jgi:hypothetical protein